MSLSTNLMSGNKKVFIKDFIIESSRQMGALVRVRDEDFSLSIPEIVPSDSEKERFRGLKKELKSLELMSISEFEKKIREEYHLLIIEDNKIISERKMTTKRLMIMLKRISSWEPPTEDHVRFKEIMIEQLEKAIEFEGSYKYLEERVMSLEVCLEDGDFVSLYSTHLVSLKEALHREFKRYKKELDICYQSNKWINDLKDSLVCFDDMPKI